METDVFAHRCPCSAGMARRLAVRAHSPAGFRRVDRRPRCRICAASGPQQYCGLCDRDRPRQQPARAVGFVRCVAAQTWRPVRIGNLVGSNVLDTLLVPGTAAVISPIVVPSAILLIDLPVLLVSTLLVLLFLYVYGAGRARPGGRDTAGGLLHLRRYTPRRTGIMM